MRVLFVTTSHNGLPDLPEPTGLWLEELTTPFQILKDAGCEIKIVSAKGGKVPVDPRSLASDEPIPASVEQFMHNPETKKLLDYTDAFPDVDVLGYDAIFFPGGHGTMWDLPNNPEVGNQISKALEHNRIIAAVCHGPACFIGVCDASGNPIVKDKHITCFSDSEEKSIGLDGLMPFLLESALRDLGADITIASDFVPCVMRSGLIITGQNPASSKQIAEFIVSALGDKSYKDE